MPLRRVVLPLLLLTGCPNDGPVGDTDGTRFDEPRPVQDAWRVEIDQPFDASAVQSLSIGGASPGDNFANRGDVIVRHADTDRITVEVRRFTHSDSMSAAQDDFDRLSLWAYAGGGTPQPPAQMDAADGCVDPSGAMPWPDGCSLRLYYEGLVQVVRSGADIRVTLPRSYTGSLDVETEDDDADADYQNRGDVCIEGLAGSAEVDLGAGRAFVILAADLNPFPTCSASEIDACEDVGWAAGCPCLGVQGVGGGLVIRGGDGQAADATVDVPEDLWGRYALRNEMDGMDPGDDTPGASCEAVVDAGAGELQPEPDVDLVANPALNNGVLNQPPPPAPNGAGYSLLLQSDRCEVVQGTSSPDAFVGAGMGATQDGAERGNLEICAGCLRTQDCDQLIAAQ